ncbi:MAG TPA: CDP-alcohol phosphatidyltransferase family protein [Candidatus Aquilonibacter sp.]|nr:CDP-alcohol phosphatidyltransferase family protein [Candidatus Aquilonibacter sp.]
MTPNRVTIARVGAGFAAVGLFSFFTKSPAANLVAIALTVTAIALDGLDGYLARAHNLATPLGAQLDILGDRVIENLFFTFFAVSGLISLWVPVAFFARGTATDFLRGLAARAGQTGFGSDGMLRSIWGRILVSSRFSRAAYAALKCLCFCYLGALLTLSHLSPVWTKSLPLPALSLAGRILAGCSVFVCLIRAIPVIWEGCRFLPQPQKLPVVLNSKPSIIPGGAQ